MAIKYDLKHIESKLNSFQTFPEKLNYLSNYLFELKKKKAEFIATDSTKFEHLKIKTTEDYKKYRDVFDKGGLIYFNGGELDELHYKRIGFENIPLLRKRLHLENTYSQITGDILLFEGLIEKVKSESLNVIEAKYNVLESESTDLPLKYYCFHTGYFINNENGEQIFKTNFESPYQLNFSRAQIREGTKLKVCEPTSNEVLNAFGNSLMKIFKTNPNEIEPYLEYHFKHFQGEKKHWLRYSKIFIKDRLRDYPIFQDELNIILEWFKEKEVIHIRKNTEIGNSSNSKYNVEVRQNDSMHLSDLKPLSNYNQFFWAYETYLQNVQSAIDTYSNFEVSSNKFNPNLINFKTQKTLTEKEISTKKKREYKYLKSNLTDEITKNLLDVKNIIHRAKQEIQNLAFTPNPNTDLFLKSTARKLNELISKINSINRKNVLDTDLNFTLDENILPAIEFEQWFLKEFSNDQQPETEKRKSLKTFDEIKPRFKPESIQQIFEILKGFFNNEDQKQLLIILKSGGNSNTPLIFLDNGNRLADAFKQLIKTDFITGCEQKELESWICNNFNYR